MQEKYTKQLEERTYANSSLIILFGATYKDQLLCVAARKLLEDNARALWRNAIQDVGALGGACKHGIKLGNLDLLRGRRLDFGALRGLVVSLNGAAVARARVVTLLGANRARAAARALLRPTNLVVDVRIGEVYKVRDEERN